MTIKDSPDDLDKHEFAVWLKDGEVAIDFHLSAEICDALDYPRGTCAGYVIEPARARQMAEQLVEAAQIAEADAPTVPIPIDAIRVQHDGDVETLERPGETEILGGPSKDRFAHLLHMMAVQFVEHHPEIECTVVELLSHATGRARKAKQH